MKRKQDVHVRTLVLGEAWEEPVSGDANYDESLDPANRRCGGCIKRLDLLY